MSPTLIHPDADPLKSLTTHNRGLLPFLVPLLSCLLLFRADLSAVVPECEVEGSVRFIPYNLDPSSSEPAPMTFRLSVVGTQWYFHATFGPTGPAYQELAFDGATLYYLSSFYSKEALTHSDIAANQPNIGNAWMFNGPVPHHCFAHRTGPVWLAFASTDYLDSVRDGMVEPIITYGVTVDEFSARSALKQKAYWSVFEQSPHLVKRMVFFHDGYRRVAKEPGEFERLPPPYDNGYTNALYTVHSTTNLAGRIYPAYATLDTFVPKQDGRSSNDLVVLNRYELYTHSISQTSSVRSFVPQLYGPVTMTEARIDSPVGAFTFVVRDKWPRVEEVRAGQEFQKRLKYMHAPPKHSALSGVLTAAFIVLLLAPFLVYAIQHKPHK